MDQRTRGPRGALPLAAAGRAPRLGARRRHDPARRGARARLRGHAARLEPPALPRAVRGGAERESGRQCGELKANGLGEGSGGDQF